jgi:hypothetical protein
VEAAEPAERPRAGDALYKRFALFAAHDFEHMNEEETEMLCALHDAFSDDELKAIEGRIVADIPPAKMSAAMTLMMPALNHGERVEMVGAMQRMMPEHVFTGLLTQVIKPALPANDYSAMVGELMLRAA